jgi:hypothetical protein
MNTLFGQKSKAHLQPSKLQNKAWTSNLCMICNQRNEIPSTVWQTSAHKMTSLLQDLVKIKRLHVVGQQKQSLCDDSEPPMQ